MRVKRPEEPAALSENRVEWVQRWERRYACGSSDWATDSARKAIRDALRPMTHGKCVYCESELEVSGWLEVEHYEAKGLLPFDPERAFKWENLFPACGICNGSKGVRDHGGSLIKADIEDPEPLFWLNRGSGEIEPHPMLTAAQRARAEATISMCALSRGRISSVRSRLFLRVKKAVLKGDMEGISEALDPGTHHKLVVRTAFAEAGRADLAEEDRRRFLGV